MTYSVEWTTDALHQLAAIWNVAKSRASVTAASHQLDLDLKRRPREFGEDRDSPFNRTAFASPLGIDFEIIEDDKKVRILRVWAIA